MEYPKTREELSSIKKGEYYAFRDYGYYQLSIRVNKAIVDLSEWEKEYDKNNTLKVFLGIDFVKPICIFRAKINQL